MGPHPKDDSFHGPSPFSKAGGDGQGCQGSCAALPGVQSQRWLCALCDSGQVTSALPGFVIKQGQSVFPPHTSVVRGLRVAKGPAH